MTLPYFIEQYAKEKYSTPLINTKSIFSLGTGKDLNGDFIDVSSNIINNSQVNVGLEGRTYTNLLGDDGDCEEASKWSYASGTLNTDADKIAGSNSIVVTATNDNHMQPKTTNLYSLYANKFYFVSGYIKRIDTVNNVLLCVKKDSDWSNIASTSGVNEVDKWERVGKKFTVPEDVINNVRVLVYSGNGLTGNSFKFDGIMIKEITQDEYNNLMEDELLEKYPFINNTKSTVCAGRLECTGKNLFDEIKAIDGFIDTVGTIRLPTYNEKSSEYIQIKPGQSYTFKVYTPNRTVNSWAAIAFYDEQFNFIYRYSLGERSLDNITLVYIAPDNAKYCRVTSRWFLDGNIFQLENGNTATEYEPYKDSKSYILSTNEDGNVDELRSLPNGVKDEVKDGKLYKRTNDVFNDVIYIERTQAETIDFWGISIQLNTNQIWKNDGSNNFQYLSQYQQISSYGNFDALNDYCWYNGGNIDMLYFKIPKSEMVSVSDNNVKNWLISKGQNSLIYQYAEPIVIEANKPNPYGIDFSITGSLQAFKNGTFIREPYLIKDYNTTGTTFTLDKPITNIDEIYKVVNGELVDTTGTLSDDGNMVMVSEAGTYHTEGAIRPEEDAGCIITHSVPVNTMGLIESTSILANKNSADLQDYIFKNDAHLLNIEARLVAKDI